jgi:hypothetical protein
MDTGTAIVTSVGIVVAASLVVFGVVAYVMYRIFKEM